MGWHEHSLYDDFVQPFNQQDINVYRYDARGHGRSEGKWGYVKSYWEMAEDRISPKTQLQVYTLKHIIS